VYNSRMSEAVRTRASTREAERSAIRISVSAVVLGFLAAGAAAYYAACGVLLHLSFHSYGWDLGIFDQVMWSIVHGHGFHYSFRSMPYLGDHFQPVLASTAPLVFLGLGPVPILVLQGVAFGAAVIPLYAAVRRLLGESAGIIAAWAISLAYLLSLGLARADSYDWHPECFVPVLAFTALWALTAKRSGVFALATLALLPLKEDMGFLALGMCWVAWLAFAEKRAAGRVALVAVAYTAVTSLAVVPLIAHGNSNPLVERYPYLGNDAREIALNAVIRPDLIVRHLAHWEQAKTVLYLLGGVAFLPMLRPRLLLPLVVVVVLPMLSVSDVQRTLSLHYGVVPYAFSFVLAALALEAVARFGFPSPAALSRFASDGRPVVIAAGVAAVAAIGLFAWKSPLPPSFAADASRYEIDHHADVAQSFVDQVPGGIVISAQATYVPHLSERFDVYEFPRIENSTYVIIDDKRDVPGYDQPGYQACRESIAAIGFRLERAEDGIEMYTRSAEDAARLNGGESCG